ncbi:MAG TPA: hypothetical protein H9830_04565 [Candidatus Agrococcus pullicola]|uniref:Protein kinase domain-containing protein n=1 Tax=Candidatus Agrococcus pullicola TaxID=2838429 RepID=A0A9D1YX18_9MICO|nr:hypothetical protein [Candidatus Agrococcus pullicola]
MATLDGSVVLLCSGSADTRSQIAQSLAAASRVAHDHLLHPEDYWTEEETLVAVYRPPQRTLADLLRDGNLSDGAAVTVLVPALEALEALHSAGIAGVDFGLDSVYVDEAGAPKISLHGTEVRTNAPTVHWRRTDVRVEQDAVAAEALLSRLLADSDGVPKDVRASYAERRWQQAAEALLAWRQPLALSAVIESDAARGRAETRVTRRQLRHAGRDAMRRGWWLGIERISTGVRRLVAEFLPSLRSVRRSVWIMGALGVSAAVAAGVFVLWTPGSSEGARTEGGETPDSELFSDYAEEAGQSEFIETDRQGQSDSSQSTPDADEGTIAAVLEELLFEREACLGSGDIECLGEVVMAGTLLYSDDASGMPQWRAPKSVDVQIDQHLGDAVIATVVSEEQPVSVLAVNTETGWLLREIWPA